MKDSFHAIDISVSKGIYDTIEMKSLKSTQMEFDIFFLKKVALIT